MARAGCEARGTFPGMRYSFHVPDFTVQGVSVDDAPLVCGWSAISLAAIVLYFG
jgi:hypothetical protein